MMAAGRAAENGARVLLLEKNKRLGIKLSITGKGRCNITKAEFDLLKLVKEYGPTGKFLFSAFNRFGPQEVIDFFQSRHLPLRVERGDRVFPDEARAYDVIDVLKSYLKTNQVEILFTAPVKSIVATGQTINWVILSDGREFSAREYAICTGGKSYPLTGSTGDAYGWLAALGHHIVPPQPALTAILVRETWVKDLEGLSLKNVAANVFQNGKKVLSRFGEALFTDVGLSGPIIIDASKAVGGLLKNGRVNIELDFKPALSTAELDQRLQRDFSVASNKLYRNSLGLLLPHKLIPTIIKLSKINPDKKVNSITREERHALVNLLKHFSLEVVSLAGFDRAVVTAGGVDVKEINPQTMRSRLIKNLFIGGELLDLDGPTGGYNLQICWSTGFVIGENFAAAD